jgi:CubicO group peptidase (beta-lactamase class C family)
MKRPPVPKGVQGDIELGSGFLSVARAHLSDLLTTGVEYAPVTDEPLALIDDWPVPHAAVGVTRAGEAVASRGPGDRVFALASVTKLLTAMAVLVAVEEGTVGLDDPAGPEGATVAHLLAHASGLDFEGAPLSAPGKRRIYSNGGFELLADLVAERAGMAFADYLSEGVLRPLGMDSTRLEESPAWGGQASLADMLAFGRELLQPRLVSQATLERATAVAFPGLSGVVPGFGRQDPNDWGLGFEIKDAKSPHWTGKANSPPTFGHFGRSGTFLWVDPEAGLACACLTDREFGPWAKDAWPALSDAVVSAYAPGGD